MSQASQQNLAHLERIDAHISRSEQAVTKQQARVDGLESAGNDSSLSRSVLKNFKTCLELQYSHRASARRELRLA